MPTSKNAKHLATPNILLRQHFFQKACCTLLSIIFLFLWDNTAFAREAKLTNVIVTKTKGELLLFLQVEGAFAEDIEKAILSGVPTTFTFYIRIKKIRKLWADKKITDIKIDHSVKYNNLKKEFSVTRSWENGKVRTTQSFDEAKKLMGEIDSFTIFQLNELEKNRRYRIDVKAELKKVKLPFYLHNILFFVSLWDFETDWLSVDFLN